MILRRRILAGHGPAGFVDAMWLTCYVCPLLSSVGSGEMTPSVDRVRFQFLVLGIRDGQFIGNQVRRLDDSDAIRHL